MTLIELITGWRNYIVTPENDYSDGVRNGLSEAADELEDWAGVHAMGPDLRNALKEIILYSYDKEKEDYEENGDGGGHIFTDLDLVKQWLERTGS